jgi:PEP-CTERM motif
MTLTDSTNNISNWASYTFNFTGTGSDTLTIAAQTDPGYWFVDDISVPGGSSTTPEPASFFLMGSGLVAMGGILRRRIFRR